MNTVHGDATATIGQLDTFPLLLSILVITCISGVTGNGEK